MSITATAASRKKIATMSLRASPAWSASSGALRIRAPRNTEKSADTVGAADAPEREQAADEPAEVEQRREEVAVEGEHPDRVEDFGVGRVEPGEELGRDVVEVPGVAALVEARRERAVVPGRVETGHAGRERFADAWDEVERCDQADEACDQRLKVEAPGRGACPGGRGVLRAELSSTPLPPCHPRQEPPHRDADGRDGGQIRERFEEPDRSEKLGDPDQEGEGEDGGGEVSGGPGELGEQAVAESGCAEPGGGGQEGESGDAEQVARRGRASTA